MRNFKFGSGRAPVDSLKPTSSSLLLKFHRRTLRAQFSAMHRETLEKNESRVNAVEMRSLRSMCGVSLKDRRRNSDVRERCGLKEVVVTRAERGTLRWFGYLERRNESGLTKQIHRANMEITGLERLLEELHTIFASDYVNVQDVQKLMVGYKSDPKHWKKYAKFDRFRYTRNLVDAGNGAFNVMILCWGPGHASAIHDHADSHCFMKLLSGSLEEIRYGTRGARASSTRRRRTRHSL
ncbi:Cysteine dioxygenase type 1 [Eumeta japonica]|uniref:Cysteine dioxygenase n=1 Tax=Eumeta variegata TaxID=151549 RepID=A0A4C1ZNX8_EUMVA|nr:Cysteine dioxygenase type 1 [Eumeta japonica]